MTRWIVGSGPDVPLHFTAFHPDWKMLDKPPRRRHPDARAAIALATASATPTPATSTTRRRHDLLPRLGESLIGRDWLPMTGWHLDPAAAARAAAPPAPAASSPAPAPGAPPACRCASPTPAAWNRFWGAF